jgi:hypothetical protein
MSYKKYFFSSCLVFGLFFVAPGNLRAATDAVNPPVNNLPGSPLLAEDNDAIAVRVLPNPNHYSAIRWYQSQNFSGSPQSLLVDGYDAVRDGRTVYINAANIDTANKKIYTNIYLISYNQNPNFKTVDVLGQIIKHWRFNSNLNTTGNCHLSTISCQSDADCGEGFVCFDKNTAPGRCRAEDNNICYTDEDCSRGIYCDSLRAKIARDVRRLGMLGDLRESLSAFKKINNKYPILGSGTYLPLNSLSVWPSWQALFLPQLGVSQSLVDPINSLGPCAGFDVATCWDKTNNTFADAQPSNNILELPASSYAFVYSGDSIGSNYSLCAAMETKSLGYNTTEGQLANSGCVVSGSGYVGSSDNVPPVLISSSLRGEVGQEFNGFIKVLDPDGNPLDWSINTSASTWTNWRNNNQNNSAPSLYDTNNPNQKKIYAQLAGNPGSYNLTLNVADSEGASLSTVTPIVITNSAPLIQSDDVVYYPSVVLPLSVSFSINDKHKPVSYTFAHATWNSGPYDLLSPVNATFLGESSNLVGDTKYYTLKYNLKLNSLNKFTHDTNFVYLITAKDKYNLSSTRQVNITIKVDNPLLDFNCNKSVRLNNTYYCGLGWKQQGDHTITYSAIGSLPAGLTIKSFIGGTGDTGDGSINTSRLNILQEFMAWLKSPWNNNSADAAVDVVFYALTGKPTTASSSFPIKIKAENEFGALSQREFSLDIDNYCGDGLRQNPNTEGRGGFYNDGYEDCDGESLNSGVVVYRGQIADSSPNLQYGCSTNSQQASPFPIMNNQYCIYLAPDAGGGYCGDGICQAFIIRNQALTPWEIDGKCPADCSCAGAHQVKNESGYCVCENGWYDCNDVESGCESNHVCDAVTYFCGDKLYPASPPNNYPCGINSKKCYTGGGSCTVNCPNGTYNCDGTYACEASSCSCPSGQHWDSAAWPNAKCVGNENNPVCNGVTYNPESHKCCNNQIVCNKNDYCCNASQVVTTCTNSAVQCAASLESAKDQQEKTGQSR